MIKMNPSIEIDELYKETRSCEKQDVLREDILHLIRQINTFPPQVRQADIKKIAEILAIKLQSFNDWQSVQFDKEFCEEINKCIDMIAVTEYVDNAPNAYTECFRFLNRLRIRLVDNKASEIVQQYWAFQDILPMVKGLFLLEKCEGVRLYPIYEMMIGMIQDFECDNDHLVNLAIALQMFETAGTYAKIEESAKIREEILKIADKRNIQFLRYLVEGGTLLFDEDDYKKNGTLMVVKNRQIIIRNIKPNYFSSYFSDEIIEEENQLAWFATISLNADEELTDLADVFYNGTQHDKQKLLEMAEEEEIFNIFLPKRIVRNKNNHEIKRFLNPASAKDRVIVCCTKEEENSKQGFLKMLRSKEAKVRGCWIFRDNFDVLTVDFYAAFFIDVVKDRWKICVDLETGKEQFYQGWLIDRFLTETLNDEEKNDEEILKDLYDFLIQYFDFKEFNEEALMDGRLLAFPCLGNFIPILKDYFSPESMKKRILSGQEEEWECGRAAYCDSRQKWEISGRRLKESEFLTSDLISVTEGGQKLPKEDLIVFISQDNARVIYSDTVMQANKRLRKIQDILERQVVKYDSKGCYMGKNLDRLLHLMDANNFDKEIYDFFQADDKVKRKIVCLYKVLWHFQIFNITKEHISNFWRLILEKHYCKMVEDESSIKNYFDEMSEFSDENGTLVIAKESSGNDSTLHYLYQKFGHGDRSRKRLSYAFDAGAINKRLKIDGNKITWNENELKKIIFMSDNLMNGGSLRKMLNYQIKGEDDATRDYVRLDCPVSEILKKNPHIKVEIHIAFGFKNCVEEIEKKYPVSIVIHNIIPEKFRSDSDTVKLVEELYDRKTDERICCVFRYNNQPFKSVLPEIALDSRKRVGLFQRTEELN